MQERIVRKRLVFSGAVQGVGFRWRSRQAASAAGATGWVQNEGDGSVTMELQGTEEQIDRWTGASSFRFRSWASGPSPCRTVSGTFRSGTTAGRCEAPVAREPAFRNFRKNKEKC